MIRNSVHDLLLPIRRQRAARGSVCPLDAAICVWIIYNVYTIQIKGESRRKRKGIPEEVPAWRPGTVSPATRHHLQRPCCTLGVVRAGSARFFKRPSEKGRFLHQNKEPL